MKPTDLYDDLHPLIPRRTQIALRLRWAFLVRWKFVSTWPIDVRRCNVPARWLGSDGKRFSAIMTHDVDTRHGHEYPVDNQAGNQIGLYTMFIFLLKISAFEVTRKGLAIMPKRALLTENEQSIGGYRCHS